MYTPRLLAARLERSKKSALILGPRQAGKSTLIRAMKPDLTLDLSDEVLFIELNSRLERFRELLEEAMPRTVFVDEIQRMPQLLNLVQHFVDRDRRLRFFLTGSSARKLKRGGANLLPGRVLNFHMGPLVAREVDYKFSSEDSLIYGALPEVHHERDLGARRDLLRSYSVSYLREEIQQEALVRNLPSFTRFFQAAASEVGRFIDFSKLAKRAQISRHSIPRFFEILEDTLVGILLRPFPPCADRSQLIKHPKFYFFDNGVYNGLFGDFKAPSDRRGGLAEQLIVSQFRHSCWAIGKDGNAYTFRTRGGLEIDFIFEIDGDTFAVETKASENVDDLELRALKDFARHFSDAHQPFVFHLGKKEFKRNGIWCLPWQSGFKKIGL